MKAHLLPLRFYSEKRARVRVALRRQVVSTTAMAEIPSVQKGWKYSEYGPPDVLTFGDLPVPQIADDQVRNFQDSSHMTIYQAPLAPSVY